MLHLPQQETGTWWAPQQVEVVLVDLRGVHLEVCKGEGQAAPQHGLVEAPLHSGPLQDRRVQQGAVVEMVVQVQGEVDLHAGGQQLVPLVSARQDRVEPLVQPLETEQTVDVASPPTVAWMGREVLQGELQMQARWQRVVLLSQAQKLEVELLWPAQVEVRQVVLYQQQLLVQEYAPHSHLLPEKLQLEVVGERGKQKEVEQRLWAPEQT